MNDETDAQLIALVLTGNRLAAGQLSERYRKMVLSTAYQALGSVDDAADVAQEALIHAYLHLSDLRERNKFASWLRSITLSKCADYRRRRGTRHVGEPITVLSEASEETDYVERLTVRNALAGLSEAHHTTVLLHYEGGWSLEEIAVLLTIPVNTVRSRLMAAKNRLRTDLHRLYPDMSHTRRKKMTTESVPLPVSSKSLLDAAYPAATILSVQNDPEPWMPFSPRVRIRLAEGSERTIDVRRDIDPDRAEQIAALERLGIPGPRLIFGPIPNPEGMGHLTLCEVPRGENLLLWAMGGTPHRIRLATERAFEAIDRLQGATEALVAEPVGQKLKRRSLTDEADLILDEEGWRSDPWLAEASADIDKWRADPWFRAALSRARAAAADITDPLVLTNYLHFFPNWVRIEPGSGTFNEPLGWPGDARYQDNPISEIVTPFGHLGDPLLGLAMVWVYDCYPFVHTGFVEQFLWRRGVSRREFAPRLAIKALQMIARDLPVQRPDESRYWDGLHGWVEQALAWM